MSKAGVDGSLLDDIEDLLRGRDKDEAMTSSEIADELGIEDGEANPKTREAIRILTEERGVPIASNNAGSWHIENRSQLDEYLATLDSRIQGIQERKQLVTDAFRSDQRTATDGGSGTQAQAGTDHADSKTIRKRIREYVDGHKRVTRDELEAAVAGMTGAREQTVSSEIDQLEKAGFLYLADEEVRLP